MGTFQDLTGKRFGKLVVTKFAYIKNKKTYWELKCDCGNTIIHRTDTLHENSSCGCYTSELKSKIRTKHGYSNHRLKSIYYKMLDRVYNPKNQQYKNYGSRGIKVCDEWLKKPNGFINFLYWAINNGYSDDLTIDRIDVNGNYEPNNCRWADTKEQNRNTRRNINITYQNETHCLTDWANILGIKFCTLSCRLKYGWSIKKAFTTPVQQKHKKS